ncbi:MAG TPA: malate synthase G [Xanthobacteraceae bacterium]|jgi:malate synthase|nr:malate synthase G [Xanthobacteraceae bacterium]
MTNYVSKYGLRVASVLFDFIEREALPDTGISHDEFWGGFSALANELAVKNRDLIVERDLLQSLIDDWHRAHRGDAFNKDEYEKFLRKIGYLLPEGGNFSIQTTGTDPEISQLSGPQLVVPLTNARFALNAVNARWGSLYDALYGTDAISQDGDLAPGDAYNSRRGEEVIAFVRDFLDRAVPLASGSYREATGFAVADGALFIALMDGSRGVLAAPEQFVGYDGDPSAPSSVLLAHNRLHIEVVFDRTSPIGKGDRAGICDVKIEAALTTIMDCEDAVAAVDADDKTAVYRNWLGLMKGTLTAALEKNGRQITRTMQKDREFIAPDGQKLVMPGRSLLLVRNVGHLMTSDAVLLDDGSEIPEGILDCVVTSLIALHDLNGDAEFSNSRAGSIYIVKPKMHGPAEVAFANYLFERTEDLLGLVRNTIKLGLMDEERRTSVNLKECIRAAKSRIVFINTGFLDRTGDEIHTSMHAGPMLRKEQMKSAEWFKAYEDRNVAIGLACGFEARAQIGKGMWAMPDRMADMLKAKIAHPQAGANTAWVPSPTAATLHALHYHQVDVVERQKALKSVPPASVTALLALPVVGDPVWSEDEIRQELENNIQGILGYVVRWIDQGVGCSKVPDIRNIGLMEDRATLRISSQHIANWLLHGVTTKAEVLAAFSRVAHIVDQQNAGDRDYQPMAPGLDGIAFRIACELVFDGYEQPNGYTDLLLHRARRERKQANSTHGRQGTLAFS